MRPSVEIFVKLLDEGVDVWRPVRAQHQRNDTYLLVEQPYEREVETWQFQPGDVVVCDWIESSDGQILAAIRLHDD